MDIQLSLLSQLYFCLALRKYCFPIHEASLMKPFVNQLNKEYLKCKTASLKQPLKALQFGARSQFISVLIG